VKVLHSGDAAGTKPIVATNIFSEEAEPLELAVHAPDSEVAGRQIQILAEVRKNRDNDLVQGRLDALAEGARSPANLMPLLIECARADASLGEMVSTLKTVFGEFVEPPL
jgi:methylmalonyl-CoA mutase N-terminal domain/subunit